MSPEWLTSDEAAVFIGVTPGTLQVWRCNRVPHQPPYYKVGRKVQYLRADLDEWLKARRVADFERGRDADYQRVMALNRRVA